MKSIKTYWWRARANFGDALAPILLESLAGVNPIWSEAKDADLFTIGSVLESAEDALVLGSGKLYRETVPSATNVYLAVRGPLTTGINPILLGDPGLLAPELVRVPRRVHNLGILPHWSDKSLESDPRFTPYNPYIISPELDPLEVIRQIASCRKVVTSSLHGAIVADSFNIPRRIEVAPRLQQHEGGMFKFQDYNLSVGVEHRIGVTQRASLQLVETHKHILWDLYENLDQYL